MSYSYQEERHSLFTEEGQIRFIKIRDRVKAMIAKAGAFRMQESGCAAWDDMACIDRMVEIGELVELKRDCWGQFRVFTTPEVHD